MSPLREETFDEARPTFPSVTAAVARTLSIACAHIAN